MKNKEWIYIGYQPVGGLREIGFIKDSDYLMVLGGGGRTVFDCLSSIKYARDRFDYYSEKWDSNTGIVQGFDVFKEMDIICGGFEFRDILSKRTSDNWETIVNNEKRYDYKNQLKDAEVLYLKNSQSEQEISIQIFHYGITRSYGFSPTNNSFVVAESHGVYFWKRLSQNLDKLIEDAINLIKLKSGKRLGTERFLSCVTIDKFHNHSLILVSVILGSHVRLGIYLGCGFEPFNNYVDS